MPTKNKMLPGHDVVHPVQFIHCKSYILILKSVKITYRPRSFQENMIISVSYYQTQALQGPLILLSLMSDFHINFFGKSTLIRLQIFRSKYSYLSRVYSCMLFQAIWSWKCLKTTRYLAHVLQSFFFVLHLWEVASGEASVFMLG